MNGSRRVPTIAVRALLACGVLSFALPAAAQLRIVDYNIAQNSTFNSDPTGLNAILTAIGGEVRNGFSRPIDILANQELSTTGTDAAFIVAQLNAIYGAGAYAAAPVPQNAVSGGNGLPSLIYNTTTVSLLDTLAFGNVGSGNDQQPRSTLRYRLRPVAYDAAADFYIYNSHYKSDDGSTDKARRLVEAASIRDNADALGDGVHAIYLGDYNIQDNGENMFLELLSTGAGQAVDPLNPLNVPSHWSGGDAFKAIHTQSPATVSAFSGQVLGGMNDRFDFQLTTMELMDNEGMSIVPGSYHTFANDGSHMLNGAITTGSGAAPAVLTALTQVSDHVPVVADYQLPARMSVEVASIPPVVNVGAAASVNVLVENIASALTALGADELDYTLSVSGALTGGATWTDAVFGGGNNHSVFLNTTTTGPKTGTITVTATSQGAAGALFTLPVSFLVGGGGTPVRITVASDNFDAPLNLLNYSQTPSPYIVSSSGFQEFQVGGGSSVPNALRDDSLNGFASDVQGVINTATKTDVWFGVTDTVDNGMPVENPGGEGVATWTFDIAGASALEVSIDMAAMGDFEATGVNADRFNWTYALDGGAFSPLFSSSVNEAASASYTMADGDMVMVDDPLFMTNTSSQTVQLTNVLQTLTSEILGSGDTLFLRLTAKTDGTSEAYAFDNIVITGLAATFAEADFDENGTVDGDDLAAWSHQFGLAAGADKSDGDADSDGDVDGADFLAWQRTFGFGAASTTGAAVPEPASAMLAGCSVLAAVLARGRQRATV